jgi:phytoene dehydrogenase-like protein
MGECDFDVIVIGAGLGGLLSAAQFLRRGQRVVVVERLTHPGGRFTAKTFHGAQVSTGAVHMLPFGSNGELASMLRVLGVPHRVHDAEVFASFHVRGRQYACRSLLQLAPVLGLRQFAELGRLGAEMFLLRPRPPRAQLSFREWLLQRSSRERSPELYAFFERICHFGLSVDLADVAYAEVVAITKNMLRYGAPGIVDGGCAAVTGELERRVRETGGDLRMRHDVLEILSVEGAVAGVRVHDRATDTELTLRAPLVISNIGPEATQRLLTPLPADASAPPVSTRPSSPTARSESEPNSQREASGLKVHLLSDTSIIDHQGIMYCLDTERIAGIVQPSNSDRRLAPPGKHLLITHQLMRGADVNVEREAARADLRRLFGDDFGTRIQILTMSQYRGEWPVNRVMQGMDVSPETALAGLYQVGDAVKPSGYLMVEGVAQSVNLLLDLLERPGTPGTPGTRAYQQTPSALAAPADISPPRPLTTPTNGSTLTSPRTPTNGSALPSLPAPGTSQQVRQPPLAPLPGAGRGRGRGHPPSYRALHWLIKPPPPNRLSSRPVAIAVPGRTPDAPSDAPEPAETR